MDVTDEQVENVAVVRSMRSGGRKWSEAMCRAARLLADGVGEAEVYGLLLDDLPPGRAMTREMFLDGVLFLRGRVLRARRGYSGHICGDCPGLEICLWEWDKRAEQYGMGNLRALQFVCGLPSPIVYNYEFCPFCGWPILTTRQVMGQVVGHIWNVQRDAEGAWCAYCGEDVVFPAHVCLQPVPRQEDPIGCGLCWVTPDRAYQGRRRAMM